MSKGLVLTLAATIVPAILLVSACGGGAATPTATTKPAAPAAAAPTTAAPAAPAGAATTAPAATKPAAAAAAGNATAGQTVFQQSCNACHPDGNQGQGPALRGKTLTADRISRQVRNGGGGMPPFPADKISDTQLADLVAYVQSLK